MILELLDNLSSGLSTELLQRCDSAKDRSHLGTTWEQNDYY